MAYYYFWLVLFVLGGGLRTSSKQPWRTLGILLLLVCIPGFCQAFAVLYGWQGLLMPLQVLPFLILPLFLTTIVLILQWAAKSPQRLKFFAVVYGVVLMSWCIALVVADAPWASQIPGR